RFRLVGLGIYKQIHLGHLDFISLKSHMPVTVWFDRHNLSGNGDYETLTILRMTYPGKICIQPRDIWAKLCLVCWTRCYDRDNSSGKGNWELLTHRRRENPGEICDQPKYTEAVTNDTMSPATMGFGCKNAERRTHTYSHYKDCFACPCRY
uniref:WxxW domain-containing protein n=1 Tax=Mola mola TaxID=94237 RepID=A0A3Q3WNY9_MOLML